MRRVAIYTSPARGHLTPALRLSAALAGEGDLVHVRSLASGSEEVRAVGAVPSSIDDAVTAIEMDDWIARTPIGGVRRAVEVFATRAAHEVADLRDLIDTTQPDVVIVDSNSWGAQAAAEASGLPWCTFQAYPTPLPADGVPPFGPGFPPAATALGRIRDRLLGPLVFGTFERAALPRVNDVRRSVGLDPFDGLAELWTRPPRTLAFTSEAFEHPRDWLPSFVFVGPATAPTAAEPPGWLDEIRRPLLLATCSTEHQGDDALVPAIVDAFGDTPDRIGDFEVVITAGAHAFPDARPAPNVRIERFVPHAPLLERAAVVVCHGGMGVTQAALAHDVPVVVVPFGRDQPEVASRVVRAGAGTRLAPRRLGVRTLRRAVEAAASRRDGAALVGASLRAAADPRNIAAAIHELASPVEQVR